MIQHQEHHAITFRITFTIKRRIDRRLESYRECFEMLLLLDFYSRVGQSLDLKGGVSFGLLTVIGIKSCKC